MRLLIRFDGVVLSGGRSTRMGTDKAFLPVGPGGDPMIEVARRALVDAGAANVCSVGGDLERLRALGFDAVADDHPDEGPLGGLVTGLRRSRLPLVVVLTCDLPAIDAATVRQLVDVLDRDPSLDAVVPRVGGREQILTAAYRRRSLSTLDDAFRAGERSVRRAVAPLARHHLDGLPASVLRDVDRPEDLDHYATAGRAPGERARPARDTTDQREDVMDVPEITVGDLVSLHAAGAAIIDVRNPDEYRAAHVPGARLIPLGELPNRIDEVPEGEDVYVICAVGGRSRMACELLLPAGRQVSNIVGGTNGWIDAGHPTTAGDQP